MSTNVIHQYDNADLAALTRTHKWNTFARMAAIKRRKPAASRKEAHLRVRVAESHMAEFQKAAEKAGITLSAWVTERLLKCARHEAREDA
jgi:predicted HicB family RNase H-like nuclease